MKTEIYVATHKAYTFPDIPEYIPIHVGKALTDLDLNIQGDNTGENISHLNKSFCELTALYWMWKNSNADIVGLAHYRRYLVDDVNYKNFINHQIVNPSYVQEVIQKNKSVVFLPKKEYLKHHKFFCYTVKSHYSKFHNERDWKILRDIISNKYPEYLHAFKQIEEKKGFSFYNMFIAHRDFLNAYCNWVFSILFELKSKINIAEYDVYQARIFGFISERLLNVYILKNQDKLEIKYLDTAKID